VETLFDTLLVLSVVLCAFVQPAVVVLLAATLVIIEL
jgi:hypothetical protein